MAKKCHVRIKVPLFPARVCVWFSHEDYQAEGGHDFNPHKAYATTWGTPHGADIVFQKVDPEIIAHEAVHAAWDCLGSVGAKANVNNQEPLAYVVGYLVKQITKEYVKWEQKQKEKSADNKSS